MNNIICKNNGNLNKSDFSIDYINYNNNDYQSFIKPYNHKENITNSLYTCIRPHKLRENFDTQNLNKNLFENSEYLIPPDMTKLLFNSKEYLFNTS